MGKSNSNKCIETTSQITSIKLDQTGEAIIIGNNEGLMMIYDTEYGRKIRTIKQHTARISSIDWSSTKSY